MSKQFITVRFDRMQNLSIVSLYKVLISSFEMLENEAEVLKQAHERLQLQEELTKVLCRKARNKPYTAEITNLQRNNDQLIAAIQNQHKALVCANFKEDEQALFTLGYYLKSAFKGFKSKGMLGRRLVYDSFISMVDRNEALREALTPYGFMRYVDQMRENNLELRRYDEMRTQEQQQRPAPYSTQPAKDKLLNEMRLYMRTLEMYFVVYGADSEKRFINYLNVCLKSARKQLRNTTTRRIRRKEKALQQLPDDRVI